MARVAFTLRKAQQDYVSYYGGSYIRYEADTYGQNASTFNAASAGLAASAGYLAASAGLFGYQDTRDYDSALRGSGVILPPAEALEGSLTIDTVSYGTVAVEFAVPIQVPSTLPVPTEGVLVYSPDNSPTSIDGGIIFDGMRGSDVTGEITGLPEGDWAYFTLFVRYESTLGDDYYLPYARLEVLIPRNYGSTLLLWSRIPEHYRDLDEAIGVLPTDLQEALQLELPFPYFDRSIHYPPSLSYQGVVPTADAAPLLVGETLVGTHDIGVGPLTLSYGPLFRFLSIFGFEMDKYRTLLDYLMVEKDPYKANTEAVDLLAEMAGLPASSSDIDTCRLREILFNHGRLLDEKGTEEGIADWVRVLGNGSCEIIPSVFGHEIRMGVQRANYCWNPDNGDAYPGKGVPTFRAAHAVEAVVPNRFMGEYDPNIFAVADATTWPGYPEVVSYEVGMYWSASAAAVTGDMLAMSVGVDDLVVMYGSSDAPQFAARPIAFSDTRYGGIDPAVAPITRSGITYTTDNSSDGDDINHVWIKLPSPIPVKASDYVYFSKNDVGGIERLVMGRLSDAAGDVIAEGKIVLFEEKPMVEVRVPYEGFEDLDWSICFMEVLVDLSDAYATYVAGGILLERNHMGPYFDGGTVTGVWDLGISGVTTTKDYRWNLRGTYVDPTLDLVTGDADVGISVYTENYAKSQALVARFMPFIIPVTELERYTLEYSWVPGLEEIDAYYAAY